MTPDTEQSAFLTQLGRRVDDLQSRFDGLMKEMTADNDLETLARVERAKKSIAEKGRALDLLLDEARSADASEWPVRREALEAAWLEYREAVERASLELERAEELS